MKDVLVFGTGKIGQKAVHILKKNHHILFAVDNDEKKWGNVFEGYIIKAPMEILRYDCDIIIISTKYVMEISQQLLQMGVSPDRIFFCKEELTDDLWGYAFYPLDAQKVTETGKKLIQYDLLKKEQDIDCIKVMVFCSSYSVYTKQLIENISGKYGDIEFSLLTRAEESKEQIEADQLRHIYCFRTLSELKTILAQLPIYDAMQLLWIEQDWCYFYKLIRSKTKRLNLNVGGSEFYRANKIERDFKKKLIACADKVTAETEGTAQEFQEYYRDDVKSKMGILPFGIEVLNFIRLRKACDKNKMREKYHIPTDRIIVTCGHNAIEEHRHMEIIDAVSKLRDDIKQQLVFVFPMTYPSGRDHYIRKIVDELEGCCLDYVMLTEFMDFASMAEYALISDIMIHVQTTDQLSSTMLEEMYAGSIVIAGSWLPYKSLHEMGIYFLDVDAVSDVTMILEDIVTDIEAYREKCKGNETIVWRHSSWDELAPAWRRLWD